MENLLTKIGDVTIKRVTPRVKDVVKEPEPPPPEPSAEDEDEEIPEDVDPDNPTVNLNSSKTADSLNTPETTTSENLNSSLSNNDEDKNMDMEGSPPPTPPPFSPPKEDEGEAPEFVKPKTEGEAGTKRKPEENASGEEGESKKRKRRRKSVKEEETEDKGSSDSDSNSSDSSDSKEKSKEKGDKSSENKHSKDRKLTNLRRNIREVMNESELDEETKAAQRQEMERLKRVQEQQRIIREVQRQIMMQNKQRQSRVSLQSSSSLLRQCTITATGGSSSSAAPTASSSSSSSNQMRIPTSLLMKLAAAGGDSNKKVIEMLTSKRKAMRAGQEQNLGTTAGDLSSDDDDAGASVSLLPSSRRLSTSLKEELVSDSDDEAEEGDDEIAIFSDSEDIITVSPHKEPLLPPSSLLLPDTKPKGKDVVTISSSSSDDDCMILSGGSGDESEPEDTTNSGMHTNDLFNVPDEQGRVLINVGHPSDEPDIFLAPQIARVIKPHQIGGLRFLYDNVVESLDRYKNSPGFGCILAHSMGLGKTLQVIAFCDVFLRNTAARTMLCIMPINTLQNWMAEFNLWLPADPQSTPLVTGGEVWPRQFPLHVLNDSHKTLSARTKVIREWHRNGGVLLIGYELYRQLSLKNDKTRGRKKKKLLNEMPELHCDVRNKQLWDDVHEALVKPGPDLVICDEGHRIKNSHASTSVALKSIASKRRIVLTGYPLQNNLLEYWCMVDFVRPNYLGTKTEFCNMFERPIQNGQCIDSTPEDIRLMRYRAHVLHSLLEGFVQRRSHSVLQTSLPQKNEYVLLLSLTDFQRKLYDKFMNEVVRTKAVPNPLKAFSVCCKIWNHPDVLYYFLKKQEVEDVDLDIEETAGTSVVGGDVVGRKCSPVKTSNKGRPRLNAAKNKLEANKPAASINPTQPPIKSDIPNKGGETTTPAPAPIPPATEQQPGQQATPGYPGNTYPGNSYPGNQFYPDNNYPEQYPQQTPTQPAPYQPDFYNQQYPSVNNQYYPDQFNQSGYYPGQNYNQQPYWQQQQQQQQQPSGTYPQGNQTNYNNVSQSNSYNDTTSQQATQGNNYYPGNSSQYNSTYPYQNSYPNSQPETTYPGYNATATTTTPATNTSEVTVNDVKTESDVKVDEVKTETKTEVVEEKPAEGTVETVKPEEKEEEDEKKESGECDGIRIPVKLDGKNLVEVGNNAVFRQREDNTIPYDWAFDLLKTYEPGHLSSSAKMEVLFCILEESMALGDRILVFSQSLFTLNLIEDFLQKTNLPGSEEKWARNTNYYRLDGSTAALDREKLINEFNLNPKIHLFLVSTRAGSLGINLVGANRVIVFDASWNPCHDTQAVCRVYRYGQRKPCFVYRLVMDRCLEKKIYDRQINKQGMADRVVDELNPDAHLSIREVSNLLYDSDSDNKATDFSAAKDKYIDVVMQKVVDKLSDFLSKEPFQHESLLVDRKEKKLSQAERRLAKRNYELEKQATLQPRYTTYGQGGGMVGQSPNSGLQIRPVRMDGAKPIASVRPMQAEHGSSMAGPRGISSGPGRSRWIPAEVWQRQGMSAQEMTLPLDVVIPTNSPDRASIVLKAGQRVMVLKSPKGIYMQLENGKIIAIRTALKMGEARKSTDANKIPGSAILSSNNVIEKKPVLLDKDNPSCSITKVGQKVSSVFPLKSNSEITITPRSATKTAPGGVSVTPKPFPSHDNSMPGSSVWRNEQRVTPTAKTNPTRPSTSSQSFSGPTKPFYHHQDASRRNSATVAPEMKDSTSPEFLSATAVANQTKSSSDHRGQTSNYPSHYTQRTEDYNGSRPSYTQSNYDSQSSSSITSPQTSSDSQQNTPHSTTMPHNSMQRTSHSSNLPHTQSSHSSTQSMSHASNQQMAHSMTQSIGHASSQPMGHTPTQTMGNTVTQPMGHSLSQSANLTSTQSMGHSSTQPLGHTLTQSMGHSSTQALGHTSTQPLAHSSAQAMGLSSTQSLDHTLTQAMGHSTTQPLSLNHTSTQQMGHSSTHSTGHTSTQQMGHTSTQQLGHSSTQLMQQSSTHSMPHTTAQSSVPHASSSSSTSHSSTETSYSSTPSMPSHMSSHSSTMHSMPSHMSSHTSTQPVTHSSTHSMSQHLSSQPPICHTSTMPYSSSSTQSSMQHLSTMSTHPMMSTHTSVNHNMTPLNIPNPSLKNSRHHAPPQVQSLAATSVENKSKSNKAEVTKSSDYTPSRGRSSGKSKYKSKTPDTSADSFSFHSQEKPAEKSSTVSSESYGYPNQYSDFYNQQYSNLGYYPPTPHYPVDKPSTSTKKDESEKKKSHDSNKTTEYPPPVTTYAPTSTATSQSAFNTSGGGIVATSTPSTTTQSTYPTTDPYTQSQYYRNSTSSYPGYPPYNSHDTNTAAMYSAFHRPEPFAPGSSDISSFLSHPFGLPSTAPHFPSASSQPPTTPYYPQYPPATPGYPRSTYPTPAVDPYHAYPTGFNPFLVPPTTPTTPYPLSSNPPSNDGHSQ